MNQLYIIRKTNSDAKLGTDASQYIRDVLCSVIAWATQVIDRNTLKHCFVFGRNQNKSKEEKKAFLIEG